MSDNLCQSSDNQHNYDADSTTLSSAIAEQLEHTTESLGHADTLKTLKDVGAKTPILASEIGTDFAFKRKIVWPNALGFLILHSLAAVGIYLVCSGQTKFYTVLYSEYIFPINSNDERSMPNI